MSVVSNGTAILRLGDIDTKASKPVIMGKGVLFKRFADIDIFDIELNLDPDTFAEAAAAMESTFGEINLENVAATDCFEFEGRLYARLSVLLFLDYQHGTAIISDGALVNAAEIIALISSRSTFWLRVLSTFRIRESTTP